MKLLILVPEEKEMIALRREKTSYFRATGDASAYMLPPCIVLGSGGDFDSRIDIPEHFTLSGRIGKGPYGTYLEIEEQETIRSIQESLGLEGMDTGLFISLEQDGNAYRTGLDSIRMKYLDLVELGKHEMRILRQRPLKRH